LQLREAGVPIPDDQLLEACTLQNKKELIESIQRNQQQQQQMQQMQLDVQMQEIKARTQLAQSRAVADHGLAVERTSRVEENRALAIQKLSEANKNDEQATLEKVKILKEIENIDIGHIEKLLQMAQMLKVAEQETVQQPEPLNQMYTPPATPAQPLEPGVPVSEIPQTNPLG